MRTLLLLLASVLALVTTSVPASALQCVPYAREASGIALKGDAWRWWNAAAGLYDRGSAPREGAVMVFNRQGSMRHGHVSVVNRVVTSRIIMVDHANWAPARSRGRGEISQAVPVMDVSPKGDWSQVRVWYHPANDFGHRVYRTSGFVYNPKPKATSRPLVHAAAVVEPAPAATAPAVVEAAKAETAAPAAAAVAAEIAEPVKADIAEPVKADIGHGAAAMVKVAQAAFGPRQSHQGGLDSLLFN
ncbi:CHAP domain-containing protein [Magnetospirillum sp. UT-4]|uniref:CHAP domain-containing protein n=1 Tax=Magnetospirillum sp. UT-4 TaxID=2681467 RepID=UPI001381CC8E|nr:CHAP domain-containing protein [Magnetospirillum sp. UT-4]CAA7614745.1 conserved exported hypothetical protein [Magnetospirillum sp. UT-4]